MLVSCQEGRHRPALSLFAKVFCVFSCILPKVAYFQKFAFAKRSGAMKAPVGLLSDRTVLRSKMEGPRPDKFAFAKRSGAMKAPVGLLSDRTVLRSKMEGPRPDKFAFAKRSGAMKAPVGLLSDRTVLRSKMEGPRPDKFTLTRPRFCGNLSQQFNIYIFYLFAQYLRGWATPLFDFSSRYITDWQDLPKKRRHDRSVLWRLFCCRFVRCTLKIA